MCGICGFVTKRGDIAAGNIQMMNDAIKHRGPDDEGYFCVSNGAASYAGTDTVASVKDKIPLLPPDLKVGFAQGFRRLAIIDLSAAGHQPMTNAEKKLSLTFNGQIYNYRSIKQELEQLGYQFNSHTDTEVILRGYECWGKGILQRLNGMFAISIYDGVANKVWLVRDRIGIKPLFYHQAAHTITWASEMKAILKAEWAEASVNKQGLWANYYMQSSPAPHTCFRDVYNLEAGHYLEIDLGTLETKKVQYWNVPMGAQSTQYRLADAAEELKHRMYTSMQQQLQADVPVITMMSGGIDSTTITAIGHELNHQLKCYSFGIDGTGKGLDELPQAQAMAAKLGMEQIVQMVQPEQMLSSMDADFRHYEEPYISVEAMLSPSEFLGKKGYKVLLSGNGADEVFGGYGHFLKIDKWLRTKPLQAFRHLIPPIGNIPNKVRHHLGVDNYFKYFNNGRTAMRPYQISNLLLPEDKKKFVPFSPMEALHEEQFQDIYEALFYYEMKYSVGSHHVYRDDLSAMRHSVEMRYPYLDHTLVEWVAGLPTNIRYNGIQNKPLLRAAAAGLIPKSSLEMPKKGFNLPIDEWWHQLPAVRNYMDEHLKKLMSRGIFDNKTIKQWTDGPQHFYTLGKLWQLVTTEVWLEEYVD
ncbi:MAG: asparagine synthase (glutamine-hydrolyzing) [Edaphocola sp.]